VLYDLRDKLLKFIGLAALIVVTLIAILVWQGWSVSIRPPLECWGSRQSFFPNTGSYWEIAQKEFPKSDPRMVSDALVRMNGGTYYGGAIYVPQGCKSR